MLTDLLGYFVVGGLGSVHGAFLAARKELGVSKERVRQLGGTMILDSAPGRGSRLEISIPRSVA